MLLIDKLINYNIKNFNIASNRAIMFYNKNSIEESIFIISLIYLRRYYNNNNISSRNLDEVIISCLILANKFLLDFEINTTSKLELDIIKKINWNLFVNEEEYNITRRQFLQ